MDYLYNKTNLLETPQKYMYTKFQGVEIFKAFYTNRKAYLKKLNIDCTSTSNLLFDLSCIIIKEKLKKESLRSFYLNFKDIELKNIKSRMLKRLNINKTLKIINSKSSQKNINTLHLINELFYSIDMDNKYNQKFWVDKLLQRFEVTKKLYEYYLPGFRKGSGDNKLIPLYFYFAVLVSLIYLETRNLQYLSTLLKLCDLLISLPQKKIKENISNLEIKVLLSLETLFIKELIDVKIR